MSTTVLHRLSQWAKEAPSAAAHRYYSNTTGTWKTLTAKEVAERVYFLALFLESKGITSADTGAILSYNCMEWIHQDLAMLLLGSKSAGLYPNAVTKEIQYILGHNKASVLAVQNKDYFKKIVEERGEAGLPESVKLIITFDGDVSISPKAVAYKTAISEGRKLSAEKGVKTFEQFLEKLDPHAAAFMIYTSGTTGNPKGALLSHDNIVFASDTVIRTWKLPQTGSMFSFLPLCHIAEKMQSIGVAISRRYLVSFATKFDNVSKELPIVEPTLLLCVPRLWEKMMEGVMTKVSEAPKAKKALTEWAIAVGNRVAEAKFSGKLPNPVDMIQFQIAERLVLGKVRKLLGLGKTQIAASGAAPLPPHVARWFRIFGVEIYECYGMTESTAVLCLTEPGVESAGTVGKPIAGQEFKLAEDGEILARGRNVFVGYLNDDVATAGTIKDQWLHTGDLGEWTPTGLIRIKGRKKEVLKSSGGKMVAPSPIEERLKEVPVISQVCMVGDNRKYFSALITLNESALKKIATSNFKNGLCTEEELVREIGLHVENLNKSLASFEQIKKFAILDREFSIIEGEMTPTLKMKRNVIESKFKGVIDQLYA